MAGERCGVGGGEAGRAEVETAVAAHEAAIGFIFVFDEPLVAVEGGRGGAAGVA